jgi:cell division protein FtsB
MSYNLTMNSLGHWIYSYLNNTKKVFVICIVFSFLSLIFNGSLLSLWSMSREQVKLQEQIEQEKLSIQNFEAKLKMARDPSYIERQAVDNYDLAQEQDLVFLFSE